MNKDPEIIQNGELMVVEKSEYLPTPIMDRLLSAAQGGMAIEMIERFMALAEHQEKREAEKAFHRAFSAFKADPPEIVKDKLVGFGNTKYKHATIGNVVSAIIGGMSKHGLSHRWNIAQDGNTVTVTCFITHDMGHSVETSMSAGADISGGKNAIQAIASTVTYLERYTLQAATGIAVLEPDDDGHGAGSSTQPPKTKKKQDDKKPEQSEGPRALTEQEMAAATPWIDWLNSFIKSKASLDAFTDAFEGQAANIEKMPKIIRDYVVKEKNMIINLLMEGTKQ